MAKTEITWQAPEFDFHEKDVSWYWISIILAVIILSAAIYQKNFLFGIFVVLAEIMIIIWASREPRIFEFRLDEKGLTIIGKKMYPYTHWTSFSIDEAEEDYEWTDFVIQFKEAYRTPLKMKIPTQRMAEIKNYLKTFAKQIEFQHSLLDSLERLIGF